MRRSFLLTFMRVLGVVLAAFLGGCGGGTKTVSVASAPLPEQTTSTGAARTSPTTTTAPASTSTSTTPTSSGSGGTSSPSTTRTATAPAFTGAATGATGATAEGLSAAEAVLHAKGFTVNAASDYHPHQTLRVLLGTRAGAAEGNGEQAFFFVDGRYIGTDSKQPSASVRVVSQGDTEVALAYALAGGGQATVRFQLNNGKLVPLEKIPSASSRL